MCSVIRGVTSALNLSDAASLFRVSALVPSVTHQQSRSLTYYSVKKAKRKTVKSVVDRFMRLHCGLWIRRKVQIFNRLLHIKKTSFQSDLVFSVLNRLDTRRNCGRRNLPAESVWGSMYSVTIPRASFWIKWQLLFGKGGIGMLMIHTWSTTIGSTWKSNYSVSCCDSLPSV